MNEIDKMKDEDINEQKIVLANETTTMLHGEKLLKVEASGKRNFSGIRLVQIYLQLKLKK